MFSDSEEDNSDNGGNQSPDSTREIFGKRRRLNSDEEVQARSRSSTPAFSSRANSLMREDSTIRDSENEESQMVSKQYKKFYRSRSPSLSQSRSRSPSISRSRSKSVSRSQSRSRSRSLSRSKSRSRSNSSRSFINSRSPSPVNRQLKKFGVSESIEESESDDEEKKNSPHTQNLGLDISESEDEDNDSTIQTNTQASKRIAKEANNVAEDSSDDEGPRRNLDDNEDVGGNDFDNMMQRKKAENRRLRRKKDIDVINDNDDAIAKMIADMRIAAKEDRDLNLEEKPATKKMGMFKQIMQNITKVELQLAFIEANLLSVMTDWLAPMPDKSLPHVLIRSEFLRLLHEFKIDDPTRLKESGIGKAVMYLYRHPKESKANKALAGHIINDWARPIFHKVADAAHMSKDDRREKDAAMAKRAVKRKKKVEVEEQNIKPGDPGWVGRARVPMVDNQEYIKRPEWQTTVDISKTKKKEITLLEKHKRKFAERKRLSKNNSMVKISIEGARMQLGQ